VAGRASETDELANPSKLANLSKTPYTLCGDKPAGCVAIVAYSAVIMELLPSRQAVLACVLNNVLNSVKDHRRLSRKQRQPGVLL
jgi:hypothetical protein